MYILNIVLASCNIYGRWLVVNLFNQEVLISESNDGCVIIIQHVTDPQNPTYWKLILLGPGCSKS